MGRRVGRGTAGDDLGPPNPAPPPSPLRTDDDPSTKPTRVRGPPERPALSLFEPKTLEVEGSAVLGDCSYCSIWYIFW